MIVSSPLGEYDNTLVAQGSPPAVFVGTTVGIVASSVGKATTASVGKGVLVGISVGGSSVAVGMASCVCATMVNAAASAVCWTSAAFTVGTGCALHALIVRAKKTI